MRRRASQGLRSHAERGNEGLPFLDPSYESSAWALPRFRGPLFLPDQPHAAAVLVGEVDAAAVDRHAGGHVLGQE